MVGIVIVSHSHSLAVGLQEMALQVSQNRVKITTAGGVDEYTFGTNAERVYEAIKKAESSDGVLVLFDLGSALFSTQIAIEMLPADRQKQIKLCDAPIVEGTIAAAIEASLGQHLEAVNIAALATRTTKKVL